MPRGHSRIHPPVAPASSKYPLTMTTQIEAQRRIPRIPPPTPSFEAISPPQSQSSSFNESVSSQSKEYHGGNATSQDSSLLRTTSPATSLSNRSSQDKTLSPAGKHEGRVLQVTADAADVSDVWSSQQPSTGSERPTSAPKRMLNGEVKPATGATSMDGQGPRRLSRESQAADLKDRLAFAKYKLDHGYQDLKFADVEAITSQQASPTSAASDRRNVSPIKQPILRSPTGQMARTSLHSPQHGRFQHNASSQLPLSYDDFWNSQSQSRPAILAPPANLKPRNPYQPQSNISPTTLHPLGAPTTPQRRPRMGIRSPSEQRASEADAVEALAFMSSPNNSGYYPATVNGASTSPLRSQSRNPKSGSHVTWVVQPELQPPPKRPLTQQEQDAAIDYRLDAISDSDDDP